jgi:hypothetical protein
MKYLALAAILLSATFPVFGDSFDVSVFQPHAPFHIPMDSNGDPLLQQSFRLGNVNVLEFFVELPPDQPWTLIGNLTLGGQQLQSENLAATCPQNFPTCQTSVAWDLPHFAKTVDGVLTLNLNGGTEIFKFQYQAAAVTPEPTSIALLATGCMFLFGKRRAIKQPSSHS